ncbi:MAG TPA: hypothetical protein VGV88_13705 [Candidatus Dormibacteraeota bacterium]|nr:hypothetical protein [Candidatus Dormibacteraeota bacterium]
MPTSQELINRGNNLFPIGLVAVVAAGGIPEIRNEGFPRGALDELVMLVLGAVAVVWYLRSRYARSVIPALIAGGVLIMKIVALLIEDADDRGDDIGIGIVMALAIVTWAVIYFRTKPTTSG